MKEMGESGSQSGTKRSRDPEDEAFLDNFHSHKRYLSEIMASSLNGLTVGESMPENLIESPARSDIINYLRDDMPLQYSPMSEDSDDGRYSEIPACIGGAASESLPTSPSSPHSRHQRSCSLTGAGAGAVARQRGGGGAADGEGRFPSSPSDICHSADLRRAALLRSVQMRVQPAAQASSSYESLPPFSPDHELMHNMESEDEEEDPPPPSTSTTRCSSLFHDDSGDSLKQVVSYSDTVNGQRPPPSSSCRTVLRMDVVGKEEELCEETSGFGFSSSRRPPIRDKM